MHTSAARTGAVFLRGALFFFGAGFGAADFEDGFWLVLGLVLWLGFERFKYKDSRIFSTLPDLHFFGFLELP